MCFIAHCKTYYEIAYVHILRLKLLQTKFKRLKTTVCKYNSIKQNWPDVFYHVYTIFTKQKSTWFCSKQTIQQRRSLATNLFFVSLARNIPRGVGGTALIPVCDTSKTLRRKIWIYIIIYKQQDDASKSHALCTVLHCWNQISYYLRPSQ